VLLADLKLRRFTDRLKAAMQVFVALIALVLGLGFAVMITDAFSSRSVVVHAFKAPSALAARGFTGDVVASGVLDDLQRPQDATRWVALHQARGRGGAPELRRPRRPRRAIFRSSPRSVPEDADRAEARARCWTRPTSSWAATARSSSRRDP